MKKLTITLFLCALLSSTSSFGQAPANFNGVVYQDVSLYRAQNKYTPQWEVIKEEDIAWSKRVWRTIDLSDKENALLNQSATHPSIGDLLLNGVYTAAFKTYKGTDDRFTTELTSKDVEALKSLRGKKITSLKIKEDWIMLKKNNKMVVRIVAMAPVTQNGSEAQSEFWIYYPEARTYLAQQPLVTPNNGPATMDEVFEGRFFASKIDKVSEPMIKQ